MFRSATFKLTMWYLAIVMVISLAFSGVLYHITSRELDRGIRHESQQIMHQFPVFEGNPQFQPGPNVKDGTHRILLRLVVFNIVVLFGAGAASYWLARRTLEPIEAAHEQQKRFTADVSHELRTPLTALKMESEVALMNGKASAKELRATLASNLEEVGKLEALINSLLRLTKLEAEELQQSFTQVALKDIFDTAVAQVGPMAGQRQVSIRQKVSNQKLPGDRDSLVQLAVILLDNAVKYSPEGGEVELSAAKNGDAVNISIQDRGQGIDKEALQHVFDRFYRADQSRAKQAADGHGLGLSIAKMIADIHHGTITLTSQVGKGTNAVVSLPT
jgi:two-component system sensor histidine kinase CiaH